MSLGARAPWLAGFLIAAVLGPGCTDDQPLKVTSIQVGRSRNSDKSIAQQTFNFKPDDTIYAAVITEGRGSNDKIKARWTMPGGMVDEREQTVSSRDQAVVAFELRSAGGFPPGKYMIEIFLNGTPAGTREMHVGG